MLKRKILSFVDIFLLFYPLLILRIKKAPHDYKTNKDIILRGKKNIIMSINYSSAKKLYDYFNLKNNEINQDILIELFDFNN